MSGETDSEAEVDDLESTVSVDLSDDDVDVDNVGDLSVEINIEDLVAKLEGTDSDDTGRQRDLRRRIDELRDLRDIEKELDSTYNFNLDDDL